MMRLKSTATLALALGLALAAAGPARAALQQRNTDIGPAYLNNGVAAFEFVLGNEAPPLERCYGAAFDQTPSAQTAEYTITNPSGSGIDAYVTLFSYQGGGSVKFFLSNSIAAQTAPTAVTVNPLTSGAAAGQVTAAEKLAGTNPTAAQSFYVGFLETSVPNLLPAGALGVLTPNHTLTIGVGSNSNEQNLNLQWCELAN